MRCLLLVLFALCHAVVAQTGTFFNDTNVNTSLSYVEDLSSCTYQLVSSVCTGGVCPGWDASQDIDSQCWLAVDNLPGDPCAISPADDYDLGLHQAAVFIILVASMLGAGTPLFLKYHPGCNIDPYFIMLGKCMGIGIVWACSLVHMLQPASESLTSPCVPWEFNTDYNAYAFLFCMLAVLFMQFIDYMAETYLIAFWEREALAKQPKARTDEIAMVTIGEADTAVGAITIVKDIPSIGTASGTSPTTIVDDQKDSSLDKTQPTSPSTTNLPLQPNLGDKTSSQVNLGDINKDGITAADKYAANDTAKPPHQTYNEFITSISPTHMNHVTHPHEGHVHSVLLAAGMKRTVAAYLLEFGVTVHSVFIGLENGIVGAAELKTLMTALCFHQFFEGIALGSRIADANLPNHWHEFILSLIFSLAAPVGIAVGIGVASTINENGQTFLLVQGTFDGVCSGILLYIAAILLIKDFPEDMQRFCGNNNYRRAGMFICLWIGAGIMAFIGKYL